ncbi:receiver/sensor/bat box HTH-10 family transcription regulator [Halobacterium hubeiense]|uniref:Receiver/sensor/bat box HTH-10 family transcription regulator n=1 Tax=Halobacterium hubeiense TaxID=1407499 RepID=A0A0U5H0R4_9EURY|nr:bacterio-opsin activator domain-containing protein [Halobacterium hubeiense]CQH57367.1 receiver/sensor/bat box HTH-10 family transcription regulator [Halobacterium hubeiense]
MSEDARPRILLVEDNPGDARYIRELLDDAVSLEARSFDGDALVDRTRGAQADPVVHESRLDDALDYLDDAGADVVLLDLGLPDSTGLETLTTLLDHHAAVPVVVLTGLTDREVGMEALRRGAEEFLVKDEINPELLVRSIHHAIERRAHRREQKRYETLIEESTDVNAIVDPDGTVQYVTPSAEYVLGYDPDELAGENAFEYVHPDDQVAVREEFDRLAGDPDYRATVDFRLRCADGSWVFLDARGRNLRDEPAIDGFVVYTRDVTEQREYERRLEAQRERLAALNQLNDVVNGVAGAVVDQSTREEIERIACERLAASPSYEFAWVGEPDPETQEVNVRASAGTDGYLDDVSLSVAPGDPASEGPTGRALRTGEMQTVLDVDDDSDYERWRDLADEYGFRSSAAIPIRHEDTTYGVLNVYADRSDAFREQERTVVEHLGHLVGHAIAAAERKQALMSDAVVELEFRVREIADAVGADTVPETPIALERTVSVDDGEFLVYGTVDEDGVDDLRRFTETVSFWKSFDVVGEDVDGVRFELRLSDPPLMSEVASLGGSVRRVVLGEDLRLTAQFPQDTDVREVVSAIRDAYDSAEAVARRQVTERDQRADHLADVWSDALTERQRTVVETAYYAGFFEWPRATSGEDVAESLDISGPTFSQHLRAAENKIFARLVGDDAAD